MKFLPQKLFMLWGITLAVVLPGCMANKSIKMLLPADINLNQDIKTIAVGFKSRALTNDWFGGGLFEGNESARDRSGMEEAVKGFTALIKETPRFKVSQIESSLGEAYRQTFPEQLEWKTVAKLCESHQADALLALEVFDVDVREIRRSREVLTTNMNGQPINALEIEIESIVTVTTGWRLYDPKQEKIIDEVMFDQEKSFIGKGWNDGDARYNLPHPQEMAAETGFYAGVGYGSRISPQWETVKRSYYGKVKSEPDMEHALYLTKAENWIKAAAVWKRVIARTDNPNIKGKAAYNMALACEVEGNLAAAKDWARKAHEEYGNKKAVEYLKIIESRIADQQELAKQVENGQFDPTDQQ